MGGIQLILNRYLFGLYYRYQDQRRKWRCICHKPPLKCPAKVVTKDSVVVRRMGAHNHPFEDRKILRKASEGKVYTALREVEALTTQTADN